MIKVRKVEAYETQDGSLFLSNDEAYEYEKKTEKSRVRKETLKEKSDWIKEFSWNKDLKEQGYKLEDVGEPFIEGDEWGWECDDENNPIDKCVYATVAGHYDECCIFCNQPEERK